jgi:hypothetical protein
MPNVMTLSHTGSSTTLTDASAAFVGVDEIGALITVSGATNPVNNGTFLITGRTNATTLVYTNPVGVAQGTFTGSYVVRGRVSQIVDRISGLVFAQPTMGNRFPRIYGTGMSSDLSKIAFGRTTTATLNLQCVDALFANYSTNSFDVMMAWFGRFNGAPGGTGAGSSTDLLSVLDTFVSPQNAALRFRVNGAAGALTNSYLRTQAAATTTWTTLWGYDGNRALITAIYRATLNEVETWENATRRGSQSQALPFRTPANQAIGVCGAIGASVPAIYGGVAMGRLVAPWTQADQNMLLAYFNAEYPP